MDQKSEFTGIKGIAQPAQRALAAAGYTRFEQLTEVTEAELASLHGMGAKAIGILREILRSKGQDFKAPK